MPVLCEFDTESVRLWNKPQPDTKGTINFPHPFVDSPRIAHGLREVNMERNARVRVKSTVQDITQSSAEAHITTWADTILYNAIDSVLALAPADTDFLTGEHFRTRDDPASVRIDFERPFVTPPKVVVFLNHIELHKEHNWRLKTTATDIDARGFTLHIETWGDTFLYAARACWVAYPEDRPHIFSTSVNTTDVRPSNVSQTLQSKGINFESVEFWKEPSVFIALNSIDMGCQANLALKLSVDGVSRCGLTWHIDAWADSVLYSAGASIIAFN